MKVIVENWQEKNLIGKAENEVIKVSFKVDFGFESVTFKYREVNGKIVCL